MLKLTVEITQAVTLLELQHQRDLHLRKENRIRSIHSSLAIEQNTLSLEQVTAIIAGKRVLGEPMKLMKKFLNLIRIVLKTYLPHIA